MVSKRSNKKALVQSPEPSKAPDSSQLSLFVPNSQSATQGSTVAVAEDLEDLSQLSTLNSDDLVIPSSHQSSHPANREARADDSSAQLSSQFDYTWIQWDRLPGHAMDDASASRD
ncbi:hypothetical protein EJ04DRAFT_360292 [Polyplosphaeria fusca]|uniref:Uncharacterized protein n=1 Tax=Polyplosphaeria fusca TaxID=682080 RepID=A0A9P4V0A9_9PLEO|nr:hypothetical protein EJ04DRAFT_360292 [Polyplosphaeria fusca]